MRQLSPMTERLSLLACGATDRIIAWRPEGPVRVGRFLSDVMQLAQRLPIGGSMLNLCHDRYRFLLGFAAAVVAGKVTLLPSAQTPDAMRQLKNYAADVFCLHDGDGAAINLPKLAFPELTVGYNDTVPAIPVDQTVAVLFTSGSTGVPMPHIKKWGALALSSQGEAEYLEIARSAYALVGTVPAQHSYGFESIIMLTLQSCAVIWSGWPFYPADIAAALATVPRPRLLVTTPVHVRVLLDANIDIAPMDKLLSATAPLSESLASEAEHRLSAPMYEIYGCTETGQLAGRRTTDGPRWHPLPGIRLEQTDNLTYALGGNGGVRQLLGDVIELHGDGTFTLHGRNVDMVNIAGKRTSLTWLDHQLTEIDGVTDGCFFMPDETNGNSVTRLVAFVVAPGLDASRLRAALRERVDPVFLPRPLILLDYLPRNPTGKLPRAQLQVLLAAHSKNAS
jgi:acyl-coenzyme A synthetase/AMP-(fatty) acid ligase